MAGLVSIFGAAAKKDRPAPAPEPKEEPIIETEKKPQEGPSRTSSSRFRSAVSNRSQLNSGRTATRGGVNIPGG